jgi:CubicO group peptidase (beta-lactamase class C family)
MSSPLTVEHVAPGWEPVRDALLVGFQNGEDHGAGVAVFHRGTCVVDVMGGWRDREHTIPYGPDALQTVFSTTKGIMSIAVAMCVQRGLIDYSEKVATYWPEFAQAGKQDVTVAQLLAHRAGLYTLRDQVNLEDALNWDTMVARLAATEPLLPLGSAHSYHAITFGWLAGELVRRVDGRSVTDFVRQEIAEPLKADFYIGLPEALEPRVARLMAHPLPSFPPEIAKIMNDRGGPGTKGEAALSLNGAFAPGAFNKPEVHRAQVPGANGIGNARALAKIYAACVGEVDGVQLLTPATVATATTSMTPVDEVDAVLLSQTDFAMGFMRHNDHYKFTGPEAFGHTGAGGSASFADPSRHLGFSYVMNTMMTVYDEDPRRARLIAAARSCADAAAASA